MADCDVSIQGDGDTIYVSELPAPGPRSSVSSDRTTSPPATLAPATPPDQSISHRASKTARSSGRYERNERFLTQMWGGQGWYPARQFLKDSARKTQRLNAIHMQYLAAITRLAVNNQISLTSLYQPGGALYEAMLRESNTGAPRWTTKTTKVAWHLLSNKFENGSIDDPGADETMAHTVADETVDHPSSTGQPPPGHKPTASVAENPANLKMHGDRNGSRRQSSKTAECPPGDQLPDTSALVVTTSNHLSESDIRLDHGHRVQPTPINFHGAPESQSNSHQINPRKTDSHLGAAADELSGTDGPEVDLLEIPRRSGVSNAISTNTATSEPYGGLASQSRTTMPTSSSNWRRADHWGSPQDEITGPGSIGNKSRNENAVALIAALERQSTQHIPRPEMLYEKLNEYRERRAKLVASAEEVFAARVSAGKALASASSRFEKTLRAADDTNAKLDALTQVSAPSADNLRPGQDGDEDLGITTAEQVIADVVARLTSVRAANQNAADKARLELLRAESLVVQADAEIAKLDKERRVLDYMVLELQQDLAVNDAWIRLLKRVTGCEVD